MHARCETGENPEITSKNYLSLSNAHRYDVVEYVQGKYGYEKVCQIATFQTLGVKSILKSVGKTQGLSFEETNAMTAEIPDKEVVEEPDEDGNLVQVEKKVELLSQLEKYDYFKEKIRTDKRVADTFSIGKVLEGLPSATGKHAAGVIIARKNLMNYVPLMEVDGVMVSQFEKKAVESIGLLKMDFLGLQTLDVLAECLRLIQENYHKKLSLDEIPRNDKDTFEHIFQQGKTNKVFQFESPGMKKLLMRMKPTCLADLCLANAAYRPGPMQFIDDFIAGRNDPSSVHYPTKEYEEIAEETKGILFYQEQVMQIVQAMAGFSLGQADILRRGIGKKEKKYIDEGRERFVKGCLELGTADEKTAKYIYSTIEKFANYGFNKSHSDAYGLVAYLCGYLKEHYPVCFMAANSTICSHNVDKLAICLSEIRHMNIPLLLPDVRYSQSRFVLEDYQGKKAIRFSLAAIKSIREENADNYIASSKNSIFEFLCGLPDTSIRKNQIINLIHAGAFDYLGKRKSLADNLGNLIDVSKAKRNVEAHGLPSILSCAEFKDATSDVEYQAVEKLRLEKDCIQIALSGHPITPYRTVVKDANRYIVEILQSILDSDTGEFPEEIELFAYLTNVRERFTKKGLPMASLILDDEVSSIDGVIFPSNYANIQAKVRADVPCKVYGTLRPNKNGDELTYQFVIRDIEPVTQIGTLYLNKQDISGRLVQSMKEHNGVLPVVLVDPQTMQVERLPFAIDLNAKLFSMIKQIPYLLLK